MSSNEVLLTKKMFLGFTKKSWLLIIGLIVFACAEILLSPLKALLCVGFLVLLFCSWYRPHWVLLALAVVLPFEPFALKWVSDDIYVFARYASEVMIYMVFISALLKKCFHGERIQWGSLAIPCIGFLVIASLSTFVNHNSFLVDVMGLRQLMRFLLVYGAIILIRPDQRWVSRLMIALFGILFFESSVGILQALTQGGLDWFLIPTERKYFDAIQLTQGTNVFWQEGQRVFATLGRYDQLGTFLCFFILLGIGTVYEQMSQKWKQFMGLMIATGCIALILTYSRASWFGLLIGIAVSALLIKKDKRVAVGYVAAVLVAVGIYATLGIAQQYRIDVADQTVVERLYEAFSPERLKGEYYALGRMYFLIKTPVAVLAHAPLVGVGPGAFGGGVATALHATEGYTALNLPYGINGMEGYVDNNWLSILGETGYVGLILYIAMMVVLFRSALRVYHKSSTPLMRGLALGYCGALTAFAFQGLFATYFEVRTIAPYIWLFGGILAVEEMKL